MKEQELFEWLKQHHFPDLEHSPNSYDGFDCLSDDYRMFIELKSRNTHYDTLLLEKKKYDYLIDNAKELGYKAWYINYTPDGVWGFPISAESFKPVWEEKWLPITTEFANKEKMTKLVTFLPVASGFKLL